MLEGFYLRRPTEADIQAVLDLMLACDVRDVGFPDSDLDDLKGYWARMDLEQDAWLVFDKHHQLRGYGAVMPWESGKLIAVYDAPGTENTDLFLGLAILCEGRAVSLIKEINDPSRNMIAHYISDTAEYQKEILEKLGYTLTKYLFNMHRDLSGEEHAPQWPDGFRLRTINAGQDDRKLHALIQDAFEKPGRVRQSFDDWREWIMNPDTFIPELWFVLERQGKIVGCALCFAYEDMGWIRQLAVDAEVRGQGLGRKLLQHAFSVFKSRGLPQAGLAVEAQNVNALNLYQSAGLRKTVHLDEFSKKINQE